MPYHSRFGVLGKWVHFDHGPQLWLLYAIQVCNDVAARLAVVFAPVFLYVTAVKTDFSWGVMEGLVHDLNGAQRGLLLISIHFILARLMTLLTSLSAGKVLAKFGTAPVLVLGHFANAAALLALAMVGDWGLNAVILASFGYGVHVSFFWVGMMTVFAREASSDSVGRDVGALSFLVQLGTVVIPAISGMLATQFGFDIIFQLAVVVVGVGAVISAFVHHRVPKQPLSWRLVGKMCTAPVMKSISLSWAGKYVNDSVLALWPVYVFVIVGSIEGVGYLQSLALFLSMILVFFAGWTVDSKHFKRQFSIAGSVLSLIWVVRVWFAHMWGVVLTEVFERVAGSFHGVVFDSLFIRFAKKQQTLLYFVTREVVISAAAVVFWIFVLILSFVVSNIWLFLFAAAAAGILLTMRVQSEL
jgi:hypothetical protein